MTDFDENNGSSSGIKQITYTVEKIDGDNAICTQEGILYEYGTTDGKKYEELVREVAEGFYIDPDLNNWSNVKITVTAEDNAGNISSDEKYIDIDVTRPDIAVSYDNNNSSNGYFGAKRTATVVITERADHFEAAKATDGIKITAKDIDGKDVDGTFVLSGWVSAPDSANPDQATHTATVEYLGDANYTFEIAYTDKAGNANSNVNFKNGVSPQKFTVDKTAPSASVIAVSAEGRAETWSSLVSSLAFGFWSNKKITVTSESSDATSPIASVEYYKASSKDSADFSEVMSVSKLNNINNWATFGTLDILPNEQAVVYIKIADMAGNVTYVCTNGLIVDNTAPIEEALAPQITVTPQGSASGIYNGDVTVSISVEDPIAGGTYSGLKTVSYRVLNMGQVTQSGTLYTFNNANPGADQLQRSWNGQIIVDSTLNNSNDVVIDVYGEDNALNSSIGTTSIKIDTTAPSISISYDNNSAVHTATIVYSDDAKYVFGISYTDEAGNAAQSIENDVFYIDKTAPQLLISGVANHSANNAQVMPIIEFSDTNIDLQSVVITLSGANRGDNLEIIGSYSDIHNGKIFTFEDFSQTQENDDIYTLNVSLADYAGNISEAQIVFSVNRFGSTYAFGEATSKLMGTYVQAAEDVVITEVNANELSGITVTLFKNNSPIELVEGTDYTVSVEGGNGLWYKYTYTVFAENFADDGVYRISVHSEDEAGNVAENSLDTKSAEVTFGVDKTPPNVIVLNTESGETYAKESHSVLMNIDDNLKLASVSVYLDGEECAVWTGDELEAIIAGNGEFMFEVSGDSTKPHNVKIVGVDSAGNETVVEIKNFYVTTNLFVRYYNNKPLFFGSIFGIIALIAFIIFLIVYRRRKREQERF